MDKDYAKKILAQAAKPTIGVAIIEGGECVNVAVFESLETAEIFFKKGVWPDAETVLQCPEGFGIGDFYDKASGAWTKKPQPEPPEPPEPEADPQADTDALLMDMEYRLTMLELGI